MTSKILFLYGFSPRMRTSLGRLREVISHLFKAGSDVSIALLHDAVVGAAPKGTIPENIHSLVNMGVKIYVLGEDLDARGLSSLPLGDGITRINYDELMQHIVECSTLYSWM